MSTGERRRRPGTVKRWLFRSAVPLYRMGLGGLMPAQLMLTTVGRRSGRPHRAVVDIVRHDPASDAYFVASGYGEHSDWYRNLLANPEVKVMVGRRRFRARAEVLAADEAEELVMERWRQRGRLTRLYLDWSLSLVGLRARSEEEMRSAVAAMRVVALRPPAEG